MIRKSKKEEIYVYVGLTRGPSGEESTCQCKRREFNPWIGKIPWTRKWQTLILAWRIPWTEEPGGLQSMGRKEPNTTERLNKHASVHMYMYR